MSVTTKGICEFCGKAYSRRGIKRHLDSCSERIRDTKEDIEHYALSIQGAYLHDYWMYVEMPSTAELQDLDSFLRKIWLDCCGHLSQFEIDGKYYKSRPNEMWGDKSMDVPLSRVLQPGARFVYEYDFGSTTTLTIRVLSSRFSGSPNEEKVKLLARNIAPDIRCDYCGEPAELVANQCLGEYAWVCSSCAAKHDDEEVWRSRIVNSPRTGICGYEG